MHGALITVPAHFDGSQILLDVEIELKRNTPLLITILPREPSNEMLVREAMRASESALTRIWENDEDAVYDAL